MCRLIPRGHEVAGIGRRFLAFAIDIAPLLLLSGIHFLVVSIWQQAVVILVASILLGVLALGYGLYQWWAYANTGQGIGAKIAGVELVSLSEGRPIGWWWIFLRFLIFWGLWGTGIGGIALVVFMVIHERRQGWHDLAVKSVVVQPKPVISRLRRTQGSPRTHVTTVGLPPHLADAFSPEARRNQDCWSSAQQSPSQGLPWLQPSATEQMIPRHQLSSLSGQPWQDNQQSSAAPFAAQPHPSYPQFQHSEQPHPSGFLSENEPYFPETANMVQPPALPPQESSRARIPVWIPLESAGSVLEPSKKSVKVRQRSFGEVEEDDGTTLAAPIGTAGRPGDEGWYLRLDDGREVEMKVPVLLGRNPQRREEDPEVQLVPASGDGRMISRTHVFIGTDARGIYVIDRESTNGTAVVTETGQLVPAPAGVQMRVKEGQQVSYGDRWFTVLRRPEV